MAYELSVNLEYAFTEAGERIEDRLRGARLLGLGRPVTLADDAEGESPVLTSERVL